MSTIKIHNARQNNLKNISLTIPKHKITVFTGVSGSGKSSLVFETIGAEAQRQINETQNSFVRNRLQHLGVPEVDKIENLNVPIIIDQKRLGGNARSTVGTATDIYTILRLLFSRMGRPFVGYSNVFSFNNAQGMCPECEGLGHTQQIDIASLIDKNKSLNQGAIRFPTFQPGGWRLTRYTESGYFDNNKKIKDFTTKEWELLLNAPEHKPKHPTKNWGKTVKYEGVIPRIQKAFLKKQTRESLSRGSALNKIIHTKTCPACRGKKLNRTTLTCKIKGKDIAECTMMSAEELYQFIGTLQSTKYETVLMELKEKLSNMVQIGLQYLTLDRSTNTLSGGESQRIKMIKSLGNSLVDLLYIFDEPSIGLHSHDLKNIAAIIRKLRDKGNTVLIVEHDPDLIKIADWVVDMGPDSGKKGGQIVFEGKFCQLKNTRSKTGTYFSIPPKFKQNPRTAGSFFEIKNANRYNLRNISVKIPKGIMTVVTGVAGSGKSTLINQILPEQLPMVTVVDQSQITASPRSNLLTYLGLSDSVRTLFAKKNKVSDKLFSSNSEGACKNCNGRGIEKIDLAFMDNIEQRCYQCGGSGFDQRVLKYTFHNKNIADVMNLTIEEASDFFNSSFFQSKFGMLANLGMGYLTLGQRLDTFSGGERQRLKLAKALHNTQQTIVLDEPSTGLHPSDTQKLLYFFDRLITQKNTLIVIEHNLDIISQADWIIDLGPGAGKYGGKIIFEGTVQEILENNISPTAIHLRRHLEENIQPLLLN